MNSITRIAVMVVVGASVLEGVAYAQESWRKTALTAAIRLFCEMDRAPQAIEGMATSAVSAVTSVVSMAAASTTARRALAGVSTSAAMSAVSGGVSSSGTFSLATLVSEGMSGIGGCLVNFALQSPLHASLVVTCGTLAPCMMGSELAALVVRDPKDTFVQRLGGYLCTGVIMFGLLAYMGS